MSRRIGDKWFSLVAAGERSKVTDAEDGADSDETRTRIVPHRLEDYILKRLQEAKLHQEECKDEEDRYNIFYLDGFIEGDALSVSSSKVASAMIHFLQQQHEAGYIWKMLVIENCVVSEPFLEVLDVAKRLGIFPHLGLQVQTSGGGGGGGDKSQILERYGRDNPALMNLQFALYDMDHLDDDREDEENPNHEFLGRAFAIQLRDILDTTTGASTTCISSDHPGGGTTRLKNLVMYYAGKVVDLETWQHVAAGLANNDSLTELQIRRVHPAAIAGSLIQPLPPVLIDSLQAHAHLQTVELDGNSFTFSTLHSLGSVMKNPACRITSLSLSKCWSIIVADDGDPGDDERRTSTGTIAPLRMDWVADALDGSPSLQCLHLRNCEMQEENLYRILDLVDTCPMLREIDLFRCKATGPFWVVASSSTTKSTRKQQRQEQHDSSTKEHSLRTTRKSLHRLILTGNSIIRGNGNGSVSCYDPEMQELLLRFPGLGELNYWKEDSTMLRRTSYFATFSLRTNQLLAFNYAGRGNLDQAIPFSLWLRVLDRVNPAMQNFEFFLSSQHSQQQQQQQQQPRSNSLDDTTPTTRRTGLYKALKVSCRASILFCLLRQQPTQVTLEACAPPVTCWISDTVNN